jgi:curved DNA-binding protein CbpA
MANHYEVLGVAKSASTAEIRSAYARLAREKHPDRFPDPAQKAKAQEEFQVITAAFNALSNEKARREYDEALARPPAPTTPEEIGKQALLRGVQAYEAKQNFDAVELLRTAVQHLPGDPRAHAALARALSRNPQWVREAVGAIEKAIQLAPRHAPFHAELAQMLLGQNLRLRARKAAEAALKLDPDNVDALKVFDATAPESPEEPPSAGGLRGLLRRKP